MSIKCTACYTEAVPATIDAWARGVVPSETLSILDQPIASLEPVQVITTPPPSVSDVESERAGESRPSSNQRLGTGNSTIQSPPPPVKVCMYILKIHTCTVKMFQFAHAA